MGDPATTRPVVRHYEHLAPIYDWLWKGYIDKTLSLTLATLRLTGTERVLDVACGTGELERRIVARFPAQPVVGVDITAAMLDRARAKLADFPTVTFRQASGDALPFPDGSFDIVVTCSAFHYMREPQRVLAEVARVLKPGGRFLLLDWTRDFWRGRFYDWARQLLFRAHHRSSTAAELHAMLAAVGLAPTATRRFVVQLFWGLMCVEAEKSIMVGQ